MSKTRLAADIGPEAAARLSAAFLQDCARNVREACQLIPIEAVAFYRPADAAVELGAILGAEWPLAYSDGGDLGATMAEALARLLKTCPCGAMLIGADTPMMAAEDIVAAAEALHRSDRAGVVIAPSVDGGYCLIGVKCIAATASLFATMAWSTRHVFETTLQRAHLAGLDVQVLKEQHDIDDVQDLAWLRSAIGDAPMRAHATRRALSALFA